jgi:hypothetical protein
VLAAHDAFGDRGLPAVVRAFFLARSGTWVSAHLLPPRRSGGRPKRHDLLERVRWHPDVHLDLGLDFLDEADSGLVGAGDLRVRTRPLARVHGLPGPATWELATPAQVAVCEGAYWPRFGVSQSCTVLELTCRGVGPAALAWSLSPAERPCRPELHTDREAVHLSFRDGPSSCTESLPWSAMRSE